MLNRVLGMGAMLALMTTMAGVNFVAAQDDVKVAAPGKPAHPGQAFRAKQILGAKVSIENDTDVGTVDDIVLDEHGNVDYLIVANSENQLVTVPWDAAAFDSEKRVATVRITPKVYQTIPTYTVEKYPAFYTPTYRSQVYKYYGLTPGEQRRAIRRGAVVAP